MILKTLTLRNFRQFRGTHQIEFAHPAATPGKNVTVIFGENGRGKTGIFRALMFALFGERRLSQDDEGPEEELSLVNRHVLRDSGSKGKGSVEAGVELAFEHRGLPYALSRSVAARMNNGKTIEQLSNLQLHTQTPEGNSITLTDQTEIRARINAVLDFRVREYFLFDGEKMEKLTRATVRQRREVSKGIRNLLNIDALEGAIAAIDRVEKKLNQEIQSKSTGEYARTLKEINEKKDQCSEIKGRLEEIDVEIEAAEREKDNVNEKLKKYTEIASLLKQREDLEAKEQETVIRLKEISEEIRLHCGRSGLALIRTTLGKVFSYIEHRRKGGHIPPPMRIDLIEKILDEGECICGTKIDVGSEEYSRILEWKSRSEDPGVSDAALELWHHLSTISGRLDDVIQSTEFLLLRYADANNKLQRIRTTLEEVSKQIGGDDRKDTRKFEDLRRKIEGKIVGLHAEKLQLETDLGALEKDLERLGEIRKQLEREEGVRDELTKRYDLAIETRDALKDVFGEFAEEIRTRLSEDATSALYKLLDKEGQAILKRVTVNDDYSLQVLDRWNDPFLANISAGQRQIMSIAFILALARAAAGAKLLEMPLFMDTPFGRLSFEHRQNLIRELPMLCAQWILLATDTELRRREGELLLAGGKWGKFFHLRSADDGSTEIRELSPSDSIPVLEEEKGLQE